MLIPVSQFCGPYCVDPADGERLSAEASAALRRGEPICFDFAGVSALSGPFLTAALGPLFGDFGADVLAKQLTTRGLDAVDAAAVEQVKEKAIQFYAASPEQRAGLLEAERPVFESP